MKKQNMLLGIAALFLCSLLLISGCTQQKTPTPPTTTIRDILAKAQTIGPVKYDVITTSYVNGTPTITITKAVWVKQPYMKVAISLGVVPSIIIKRPDGVYVYNSVSQNYTKTNATFSEISLEEQSHALLTNVSFVEVGNETINGNATTILQYTTNAAGNSGTVKVWIWKEKGIPIKSEISMVKGSTTLMTKSEYVHFVFGDIPLSEFSV